MAKIKDYSDNFYKEMIAKRQAIKEAVTAFAITISPKASKEKYNKAWDKLCKKIDRVI